MQTDRHRLFVYGTLRAGATFDPVWRGTLGNRPIGCAVLRGAVLLDTPDGPAVRLGGTASVLGDVLDVSEATLRTIDAVVGGPRVLARRSVVVELASSGVPEQLDVWTHVLTRPVRYTDAVIDSGSWFAHVIGSVDASRVRLIDRAPVSVAGVSSPVTRRLAGGRR